MRKLAIVLTVAALVLTGSAAFANSVTFTATQNGNQNLGLMSGTMTLTAGAGVINISVINLVSDPGAGSQVITGLELSLNHNSSLYSAVHNSTTMTSNGLAIDVNSDGTYQVLGNVNPTNWVMDNSFFSGGLALCAHDCGGWHPQGIIGAPGSDGLYSGASSISNASHSPELQGIQGQPVTFHIYANGITTNTDLTTLISGANFVFGTEGTVVSAGPPPPPPGNVPEPGSVMLLGSGLLGLGRMIRRKSSAS